MWRCLAMYFMWSWTKNNEVEQWLRRRTTQHGIKKKIKSPSSHCYSAGLLRITYCLCAYHCKCWLLRFWLGKMSPQGKQIIYKKYVELFFLENFLKTFLYFYLNFFEPKLMHLLCLPPALPLWLCVRMLAKTYSWCIHPPCAGGIMGNLGHFP